MAGWDWIAAERSFQRALAINPNHAVAYLHYGSLMEALGDLERGFQLKCMVWNATRPRCSRTC
jgi:tetratricopeptide (TPR) repeat protein